MRQPDHEYEERSFGDIQRAIDFENSMNDLESQLYYPVSYTHLTLPTNSRV